MGVDTQDNVLAAGNTVNTGTSTDFTVAKFAATDWIFCAPEGGVCAFTGTTEVRYGADGTYVYQTFTDGTACTNAVFGTDDTLTVVWRTPGDARPTRRHSSV